MIKTKQNATADRMLSFQMTMVDVVRCDAVFEIASKVNFASPLRETCWYGEISTPRHFFNDPAGGLDLRRSIQLNPPRERESTQTLPIPWNVPLPVNVAML